jgi:hypothetical protein
MWRSFGEMLCAQATSTKVEDQMIVAAQNHKK